VQADGEKIHSLVKENMELLSAEEDSEDWRKYVEFLDELVLDGFYESILCSLNYLKENMDKNADADQMLPLLEAKFELQVSFKSRKDIKLAFFLNCNRKNGEICGTSSYYYYNNFTDTLYI